MSKIKEFFKKFKALAIVYPTVIMFLICLVITAALSGTNAITDKRIEKLNAKKEKAAQSRLISADEYKTETIEYDGVRYEYSQAIKNGETLGYIFKIDEKGYGGTITAMVAVNTDGSIKALEMIDVSNETPGLGQNTAEKGFTDQFKDKSGELTAVKNGTATGDTQIDAVASATISSRAAVKAVNKATTLANEIIKETDTTADSASADKE